MSVNPFLIFCTGANKTHKKISSAIEAHVLETEGRIVVSRSSTRKCEISGEKTERNSAYLVIVISITEMAWWSVRGTVIIFFSLVSEPSYDYHRPLNASSPARAIEADARVLNKQQHREVYVFYYYHYYHDPMS